MNIADICRVLIEHGEKALGAEVSNLAMHNKSAVALVNLKKRNRSQFLELERKKADVESHRELCSRRQLKLENLLYKEAHLLREIQACKQISTPAVKCIEHELNVTVGVEKHSPDLSHQHKNSLSLLRDELTLRKQMQTTVQAQRDKKNEMEEKISKKQKLLEEIPGKLSVVAASTRQLCDFFEGAHEIPDVDSCMDLSRALPSPLYVFFRSASALLHSGCSGKFKHDSSVTIHRFVESFAGELAVDLQLLVDGLSLCKSPSAGVSGSAKLILRFRYCLQSNAVYVSVTRLRFSSGDDMTSASAERPSPFSSEQALRCLFPEGMNCSEIVGDAVENASLGTCFLWAQWLCGLRPFPAVPANRANEAECSFGHVFSFPAILSFIFVRLQSLWRLGELVHLLKQRGGAPMSPGNQEDSWPIALPPSLESYRRLASGKFMASCGVGTDSSSGSGILGCASLRNIAAFAPSDPHPFTRHVGQEKGCSYFEASFQITPRERVGNAQASEDNCLVRAVIEVSPEYPLRPPRFALSFRRPPGIGSSYGDIALRALEQELNAGCVDVLELHDRFIDDVRARGLQDSVTPPSAASSDALEAAMDSTLGLQLSLLLSMLPAIVLSRYGMNETSLSMPSAGTEHIYSESSNAARMTGKNRKKVSLALLYGREFCI